jgi:hypothetical protein
MGEHAGGFFPSSYVPAPNKTIDSVKRSLRSKVRPVFGCFASVKAPYKSGRVSFLPRATRALDASAVHWAMPFAS